MTAEEKSAISVLSTSVDGIQRQVFQINAKLDAQRDTLTETATTLATRLSETAASLASRLAEQEKQTAVSLQRLSDGVEAMHSPATCPLAGRVIVIETTQTKVSERLDGLNWLVAKAVGVGATLAALGGWLLSFLYPKGTTP